LVLENSQMPNRAVFLDRDGTLIVEKNYLSDPNDVELITGAVEALKLLEAAGFTLILVTNQSAIGRGMFDEARLGEIHQRLEQILAADNLKLDGIYYCPHHPDDGCKCRKPATRMVSRAERELGVVSGKSFMIGDNLSDIALARNIGATSLLVRTGYGTILEQERVADADYVVDDILAAAQQICALS
jgi:D-glycero-D-manno-heptose 1,7-bisphosphate phosphatase